jgi:hypothetical protein
MNIVKDSNAKDANATLASLASSASLALNPSGH